MWDAYTTMSYIQTTDRYFENGIAKVYMKYVLDLSF